jgi:hypothetical protein
MHLRRTSAVAASLLLSAAAFAPTQADGHGGGHHTRELHPVVDGLDGPRGVDHLGHGKTLVTEADGTFSLVVERRHGDPKVIELGSVPASFVAPAIAAGRHGKVFILTPGGPPGTGAATLYLWRWGWDAPKPVFDVAAYQEGDPDPFNVESEPQESNPFGLAALDNGSVLIADAAGNDLIKVWPGTGHARTVARLMPRTVEVPEGLPATDPEGNPLPPAGTEVLSEGVATSVSVGPDGYWYVGELRGFPATPGTSQIWRIKPGAVGAVCNPEKPHKGRCARYADGLTSIVDLGAGRRSVYAVTLSKLSWLGFELGLPGSEIGGLFRITRWHHKTFVKELVPDQLVLPSGVDVGKVPYVTGPMFGPGGLSKIH